MSDDTDKKRKKSKHSDDEEQRREKKSKRARTRSRSPRIPRDRDYRRKRRHSQSGSPEHRIKVEKQRDDHNPSAPVRKNKEPDMLNTRTGGAYIPPARLRMMQAQITDKSSVAFQRIAWEALKKSIHGHINKINVGNIGIIIKELMKENIVRGRGLLSRSIIQAQAASPTFTNVYAALVAAVNSRFPNIGELLLKRLVIQFKRGFKRNDKPTCISSATFIAHLVNQRVAHEILALELLTLLVETPTDDSVEVAIAFLKECGQKLSEVSSKGINAIFEMLRNILHEGQLDKRVQYMIEVMFQVWKDGFKDHPAVLEELELVPEEEQFTHLLMLDEATDAQDLLNVFKFDEKYEENEQKYKNLSKEILGSDAESGEEGSGETGSEESDEDEEEAQKPVTIIDNTETNLVALRRTIYLTINSSLDFEECAHKLLKMQLKPGQEVELCHMFLDCCAEQRTYEKFYGLLAQRFCNINRIYIGPFEEIFRDSYSTAHRLDTNRLRNVSKFFAHLLFTDSIGWQVLDCVKLNEEDTTSSSRIYIKILFQELAEYMGLKKLNDRLKDPTLQDSFQGIFPRDNPKNTRFSINFFTSIGLGGLTDELREHLKQMPKSVPPPLDIKVASSSESSSSSSEDSSSDSSSDSSLSSEGEEDSSKKKEKDKKKKSKKNKDEPAKAPEENAGKEVERWGHDGFYETYGKDAQREPRVDRRDGEFIRPRDGQDRNDNRDRFWQDRNGRDVRERREEDDKRNRDDRNGRDVRERREEDDRRNRDDRNGRDVRERREEDDRRNRDDRNGRDRREQDDDRRRDDRGRYENRDNGDRREGETREVRQEDSSRRDRRENNDSRDRRQDKERDDRRNKDHDEARDDRRSRDRREIEDSRNRRDRDNNEPRRKQDEKEDSRRDRREEEFRNRREEESRNRREDESRNKREEESKNRREEEFRNRREEDARNKREEESRTRREESRNRREEESHSRRDERDHDSRKEREYGESRDRYDSNRKDRDEDRRHKESDRKTKEDKENKRGERDDRREVEVSRSRNEERSRRAQTPEEVASKSDRYSKIDSKQSRKENDSDNGEQKKRKKKKEKKSRKEADSQSSDEEDTKAKQKKSKKSRNRDLDSEKERKHEKENRKEKKKKKKDKKKKPRSDRDIMNEWDIRGASVRREVE